MHHQIYNQVLHLSLMIIIVLERALKCNGLSIEEEWTLTEKQNSALKTFRKEIIDELPHEYMKTDIYLVKWLRGWNYNVKHAKERLRNHLKWRRENRIDGILNEDFSFYKKEYPFWVDGVDYTGRPVGTADISEWDPRKAIFAGKGDGGYRFALSVVELGMKIIRDTQAKGLNVTQGVLLVNLHGLNLVQHACLQCIPYYIRFVIEFELNYPGMIHKIFLINTPPTIDYFLRILLPLTSSETAAALAIYGTNKNQWQKAVLNEIPEDQIRPQFGGTKVSNFTGEDEFGLDDYYR